MKKILLLMLVCIVSFSVVACGDSASKIKLKEMDAKKVIETLKDGGFPVEEITAYTEETDPNSLLGRDNQYTSKANANDTEALKKALDKENKEFQTSFTLEEYKKTLSGDVIGVDVEVFKNDKDAQDRLDYVNTFSSLSPEYKYLQGNVLMRVSAKMTPAEAKIYEEALKDMAKGDMPKYKK